MQLVENLIVWTCAPNLECGYDERPHKPRQVKLKKGGHQVFYGHAFDENGVVDKDTNATIFATEYNCYLTKKEANDYYADCLRDTIELTQQKLIDFEKYRED